MKKVFQTRTGKDGNCWAACLASIFEVPIEEVEPCACNHEDWWEQTVRFLRQYGLFSLEISYERNPDGSIRLWPFVSPPDGLVCIIKGRSVSELPHVAIVETRVASSGHLDFIMLHDPLGIGESVFKTVDAVIFFGALIRATDRPLQPALPHLNPLPQGEEVKPDANVSVPEYPWMTEGYDPDRATAKNRR